MNDYIFGEFLRELRCARGLSQYQLGRLVGVSDKAVSKWENGYSKPQSNLLYKLSEVLGITVDELLSCNFNTNTSEKGVFGLKDLLWKKAHNKLLEIYGKKTNTEVLNRYLSEFAEFKNTNMIIYFDLISHIIEIAKKHNEHIHINGAVGSSFVAYVMGASQVNPLIPHYFCPKCQKIELFESVNCGWDLPSKKCKCSYEYLRDGHNLPYEVLRNYLCKNFQFNISVSKNFFEIAKNEIKNYFNDFKILTFKSKNNPEISKLIIANKDFIKFNNKKELIYEEHHNDLKHFPQITLISNNDLDNYKLLEKETGINFENVPFIDHKVLKAFENKNTDGIPEFRSNYFKDMMNFIKPTSYNDIIQLCGVLHGANEWENSLKNNEDLSRILAYRDDVFNYIQNKFSTLKISHTGFASKIMDDTGIGLYAKKGLSQETVQHLKYIGADDWFINSISKIKYLFPKAHGILYVKYAAILMWYKLNYPEIFKKYFEL